MCKLIACFSFALVTLGTIATTAANNAVLIEFSSQRCKFCTDMKPVIGDLEREGIAVRRVDVDRESEMAVRFNVQQLPTYVIFADGKEAGRLVGLQRIDVMRSAIEKTRHAHLKNTNTYSSTQPDRAAAPEQLPQTQLAPVGYGGAAVAADPEPMPTVDLAMAVARAEAATVRLRVFEEVGYGVGTGTVIDSHGDELLILTCGHLFRDNHGKTKIEVDLFHGGETTTFSGNVLDYDAGDRDIALVTVRSNLKVEPVPVLANSVRLQNGASVFSFGCDRGANPSRRDTRITGINLYNQHLKLSNIEIAGAPIDGRSGGGLFDSQGNLIGVCNAADYDDDIGIYAGPGEVYWQLDRVSLQKLYSGPSPQFASQTQSAPAPPQMVAQLDSGAPDRPSAVGGSDPRSTGNPQAMASAQAFPDNDSEVIVIVRNRNRPQDQATVKVFETAPPALLEMLNR
jgi:thiol-disulfide isomerase/thioredoxin